MGRRQEALVPVTSFLFISALRSPFIPKKTEKNPMKKHFFCNIGRKKHSFFSALRKKGKEN